MSQLGRLLDQLALLKQLQLRNEELRENTASLTASLNQKRLKETGVHLVRQQHLTDTLQRQQLTADYHRQCLQQLDEAINFETQSIDRFKIDISNSRKNIQQAKENSISAQNIQRNFTVEGNKDATRSYQQAIMKEKYLQSTVTKRQQDNAELDSKIAEEERRIQQLSDKVKQLIQPAKTSLQTTEKTALKLKSLDMSID